MNSNNPKRISTWLILGDLFVSALLTASGAPVASQSSPVVKAPSEQSGYDPTTARVVLDVLKLTRAKVEPEVIVVYVQTTPAPLNLTAGQIVALKKAGVADDVLKAMVDHVGQSAAKLPVRQKMAPQQGAPYTFPEAYAAYGPAYSGYAPYSFGYQSSFFSPYPSFPVWASGTFNNSYPTYINGYPVYTGSYASLSGFNFSGSATSFNNSYPTYVGGYPVYSGYFVPGLGLY